MSNMNTIETFVRKFMPLIFLASDFPMATLSPELKCL